jgi:hypothetical protein
LLASRYRCERSVRVLDPLRRWRPLAGEAERRSSLMTTALPGGGICQVAPTFSQLSPAGRRRRDRRRRSVLDLPFAMRAAPTSSPSSSWRLAPGNPTG